MENKRIKTGIFGGSFNPIHIGHLALANYICEYNELDEIWFLVSPHNPIKKQNDLWDDNLRLELVKQAIKGYPKFKASDIEFHLPRPSYMIHTLSELKKIYPERDFVLIIGADNWSHINRWKGYETLLSEYPFFIYPRKGYDINIPSLPSNIEAIQAPILEISSTFIRQALKDGKDIRFFLPEAIRDKIINLKEC